MIFPAVCHGIKLFSRYEFLLNKATTLPVYATLLTAKHGLCHSVFTQKQVFGPRTAKSQPIWIKFCTHLLLYGIHSWADLDCDRHVGGSRPNQNDCFLEYL